MTDQALTAYEVTHAEPAAPARERPDVLANPRPPAPPPRRRAATLSVVMPCLNEAASLRTLLPRLSATLAGLVPRWEIIVVDDGSTDDTAAVLSDWVGRPGFRALRLSRNFGKEAALSAGFDAADGAVVVSMDADGQHEPELIGELLRRWEGGADMVYAVRSDRGDETWAKRAGTRLFYRLLQTGQRFRVPRDAGDFRLLDRRAVDALRALPERTRYLKGLYAWVGFTTAAVPYVPAHRRHGRSRFDFKGLFALSVTGLTAFSTWPLRAVSVIGVLLALAAFAYGAYLIVDYEVGGHPVSGWTTIVVGMALLSGVQLMSLGVVGEYLSRVFDEVKGRPLYVVREQLGSGLKVER